MASDVCRECGASDDPVREIERRLRQAQRRLDLLVPGARRDAMAAYVAAVEVELVARRRSEQAWREYLGCLTPKRASAPDGHGGEG